MFKVGDEVAWRRWYGTGSYNGRVIATDGEYLTVRFADGGQLRTHQRHFVNHPSDGLREAQRQVAERKDA